MSTISISMSLPSPDVMFEFLEPRAFQKYNIRKVFEALCICLCVCICICLCLCVCHLELMIWFIGLISSVTFFLRTNGLTRIFEEVLTDPTRFTSSTVYKWHKAPQLDWVFFLTRITSDILLFKPPHLLSSGKQFSLLKFLFKNKLCNFHWAYQSYWENYFSDIIFLTT